ncbi:MAG: amidohydrolase family protein [Trueperaceae bacterium]
MAFSLTVPTHFDGEAYHRGRHTLHVDGGAFALCADAAAPHLDLMDLDVTALPGLIDAHVHLAITHAGAEERALPAPALALRMARNARTQLRAGVTTVRDLGAPEDLGPLFRAAVGDGLVAGPRVLCAGRPLVAPGGHGAFMGDPIVDADAARRAVARAAAAGLDWIKVMVTGGLTTPDDAPASSRLPRALIAAIVDEAHAHGLPVSAHAIGGPGVRDAVEAGVDSLEHGYWIDDEDVAAMAGHGTVYVPTRTVVRLVAEGVAIDGVRPPASARSLARRADAVHPDAVRRAHAAGVPVVAGTDYRHGSLPLEIELLAAAGLAPLEALRAATRAAAVLLRRDDLGSLMPGARADLVVVRGDPLRDLAALRDPLLVVLGGRLAWAHPELAAAPIARIDASP